MRNLRLLLKLKLLPVRTRLKHSSRRASVDFKRHQQDRDARGIVRPFALDDGSTNDNKPRWDVQAVEGSAEERLLVFDVLCGGHGGWN